MLGHGLLKISPPRSGVPYLTEGGVMGEHNSSVTRVWPVFDSLLQHDPTGAAWLPWLLKLGSRAARVDPLIYTDSGPLLPELANFERAIPGQLRRVLGSVRVARLERLRNAFEPSIPPSGPFLRWLLEHPERLVWPKKRGVEKKYDPNTQEKRKHLVANDLTARDDALKQLAAFGANRSRKKWWAFEGFTSVDCRLETDTMLLLIEGKRKDTVSDSTDWFPGRNQLIRNLEVAQALAAGRKNFAVLLCTETATELPESVWANSLPHLSSAQIEELKRHYLGCATWLAIVQRICPGLRLPEKIDDAIELCVRFRS
jgi:hypothetical protein